MEMDKTAELTEDLLKAQIRLGMIARMARVNIEKNPGQEEFPEVMESILAVCGNVLES